MRAAAIAIAVAGVVYIVGDLCWVTLTGPWIYRPAIGPILAARFDLGSGLAFYAVYLTGILIFALKPALAAGSWSKALALGALLGLVCYGTYDLTNQATLKLWSVNVTIIDMSWGAGVTGFASAIGFLAAFATMRREG
jgi:uncharacterized membrane protein